MIIRDISSYGVFDSPSKILFSPYHNSLFVMGNYAVYQFDLSGERRRVIQVSDANRFVDMDVSDDGHLLLLFKPQSVGSALARVFAPDLFRIVFQLEIPASSTIQWQFQKGVFFGSGKVLIVGELKNIPASPEGFGMSSSSSSSSTAVEILTSESFSSSESSRGENVDEVRFYIADYKTQGYVVRDVKTRGAVISLSYNKELEVTLAITSGGDVLKMSHPDYLVTSVGNGIGLSDGVKITGCVLSPQSVVTSANQEAVRVYVGSKPWSGDRWDSGEVITTSKTMLYGGGDNLSPGQKYWVHIMVKVNDVWSAPQIQPFIVPKE